LLSGLQAGGQGGSSSALPSVTGVAFAAATVLDPPRDSFSFDLYFHNTYVFIQLLSIMSDKEMGIEAFGWKTNDRGYTDTTGSYCEDASGRLKYIVATFSKILERLINANIAQGFSYQLPTNGCTNNDYFGNDEVKLPKFQSSEIPGISILSYLERIAEHSKCSESSFIIALVYIDRLLRTQRVSLTYFNVHRILITR
jgi:hypothetical protein